MRKFSNWGFTNLILILMLFVSCTTDVNSKPDVNLTTDSDALYIDSFNSNTFDSDNISADISDNVSTDNENDIHTTDQNELYPDNDQVSKSDIDNLLFDADQNIDIALNDESIDIVTLKIIANYIGSNQAKNVTFILFNDPDKLDDNAVIKHVNNIKKVGNSYQAEFTFDNLADKDYYVAVWLNNENLDDIDNNEPYVIYKNKGLDSFPATPINPVTQSEITLNFDDTIRLCYIDGEKVCSGEKTFQTCSMYTWGSETACPDDTLCTGEGVCGKNECTKDEKRCNLEISEMCSVVDGFTKWTSSKDCSGSGLVCSGNGVCSECKDKSQCSGDNAQCVDGSCKCVPVKCGDTGRTCGEISDGCGGILNCGGCPYQKSCTSSGACECSAGFDCTKTFKSNLGGSFNKNFNGLWNTFGIIVDEPNMFQDFYYENMRGMVLPIGNEPSWYEWNALKYSWNHIVMPRYPWDSQNKKWNTSAAPTNEDYSGMIYQKLLHWPQSEDGFMWSWGNQEGWPTSGVRHYDGMAKYILGVYRYLAWSGDVNLLNLVDSSAVNASDKSKNRTVLEKIRLAMNFILENNNGKSGLVTITDPNHTGVPGSNATDYWDNHPEGYQSATLNIYFYAAVNAMKEIEFALGEATNEAYYKNLLPTIKTKFNDTFWDSVDKRYISNKDSQGNVWDFGKTSIQFEAMFYGLVPEDRAKEIYKWLDGQRTISSDLFYDSTVSKTKGTTGPDIYNKWKIAAVCNTKPIESIVHTNGHYWWEDVKGAITVGPGARNASYEMHLENGGAIFYTSFYDVMSRFKFLGPANAHSRMSVILNEYGKDRLRRDPGDGNTCNHPTYGPVECNKWKIGVIGEYPESGLVPTVFIYGYLGIDANAYGLSLSPNFPAGLTIAGVNDLHFRGNIFDLEVHENGSNLVDKIVVSVSKGGALPVVINATVKRVNSKYKISRNGSITEISSDVNGLLTIDLGTVQTNENIEILQ